MARIRYLKPDFFKDEDIKELSFEARLFYQGLWVQADREGRDQQESSQAGPFHSLQLQSCKVVHRRDEQQQQTIFPLPGHVKIIACSEENQVPRSFMSQAYIEQPEDSR